jgi:DNA-binding CsgD family transcriptional regulator
MLAVFAEFEREILRDRVKAGIAQARKQGKPHGRPPTVKACSEIKRLFARGLSKREIAKRLKIGRTSVRRILAQKNPGPISVGTSIAGCPRTDLGGRDSRTGLPRERQKVGGQAASARNCGYHRQNVSSSSSLRTPVLVCSKRWAPRSVHCICCF